MTKRVYSLDESQDELREFYSTGFRFGDFGNLLKVSGILVQGGGQSCIVLSPTAYVEALAGAQFIKPTLGEWCDILSRTDDPLVFEEDETGTIKAIHRKMQFAISGAIQQKIWARDGFRCMYCGQPMGKVQLTVDHFYPLELGGEQTENNYISACRKCNKKKGKTHPRNYCVDNDLDFEGLRLYLLGAASSQFIAHLQ